MTQSFRGREEVWGGGHFLWQDSLLRAATSQNLIQMCKTFWPMLATIVSYNDCQFQ